MVSITYRTPDAQWGAGKGAPLTAAEVDRNFHNLRLAVESAGGAPGRGIASLSQQGYRLTLTYSDGTSDGFDLPAPDSEPRGAWATGAAYARGDVVARMGGSFFCVVGHVAATWWGDLRAGRWMALAGTMTDSPSTPTLSLGGVAVFEVPGGLAFTPGMRVKAFSQGDGGRWLAGTIRAYGAGAGLWMLEVIQETLAGEGVLADPVIVPAGEAGAAGVPGPAAGGAWRTQVAISGTRTLTPADLGCLLKAQAGTVLRLPASGFVAGESLWLEAPATGSVTAKAVAGAIEPPYTQIEFTNERAWLVHQGAGVWLIASREPLAGTPVRIRPWRTALALSGAIAVIAADMGTLIVAANGAQVTLPPSAAAIPAGDGLWIAAGPSVGARVSVSAAGGLDYAGSTRMILEGRIAQFVSLGGGKWIVAQARRIDVPAPLAALETSGLGQTATGVLRDAPFSLSTGDHYSDAAVGAALGTALAAHDRNIKELATRLETLRLLLQGQGLIGEPF
ncbi:hypothetical protein CKO38_14735 [Rhodospirillum rubrum]|uniref:hypothetical protein n=1 Tax=Rhodospirillum rubrum TaxID=1085 RepID=UPI0019088CF7|nr:hypothetical protein [Rhodospirillum rubrum]MBK1666098.1 hypothetical protein [Rhodospirillum rubrum]MBK1677903.1 hypothetical protein [Rhodospirillum rubrum]